MIEVTKLHDDGKFLVAIDGHATRLNNIEEVELYLKLKAQAFKELIDTALDNAHSMELLYNHLKKEKAAYGPRPTEDGE